MTVIRNDTQEFDATTARVVAEIRGVLSEGQSDYTYTETEETAGGLALTTRIRPLSPKLASTKMIVTLESIDSRTAVSVQTRSQLFVFGDIFDMCRGYISDFYSSLDRKLSSNHRDHREDVSQRVADGGP